MNNAIRVSNVIAQQKDLNKPITIISQPNNPPLIKSNLNAKQVTRKLGINFKKRKKKKGIWALKSKVMGKKKKKS